MPTWPQRAHVLACTKLKSSNKAGVCQSLSARTCCYVARLWARKRGFTKGKDICECVGKLRINLFYSRDAHLYLDMLQLRHVDRWAYFSTLERFELIFRFCSVFHQCVR